MTASQVQGLTGLIGAGVNGGIAFRELFDAAPVAIYTTDANGRLTYFNRAAVKLSGRVPQLGTDAWCVTWKIFLADGTPLPHDQCPMALALRGKEAPAGIEFIAERPDGTRFWFTPHPALLRDEEGRISGGINVLVDVTERKIAEMRATANFSSIVATVPECVKIVAADGTVLLMNSAGLSLVGASSADAVIGKSVYDLIAPEDRERYREFHERVCRGEKGALEFDIVGLSGTRRHMETHAAALRHSNGSSVHLAITRDTTERRQVEEALREREAWLAGQHEALEAALNGAPLEISLGALVRTAERMGRDVRAAFYLANPEGTELHHIVGMPAGYAAAVDGFKIGPESLSCGLATHTGLPVLTSDVEEDPLWGPWRWLAKEFDFRGSWSFPIHTEAKRFVGTLAIYWRQPREATERDLKLAAVLTQAAGMIIARHRQAQVRRQAEEALRESVERLWFMAESMPQKIFTAKPNGERDYFNRQWIEFTGLPLEQIQGWGWTQVVHPDDVEENVRMWKHAIASGEPFQIVHRLRRADGVYRWHLSRAQAMRDASGKISMWIGSNTDIHEQKKTEQELRRLNEDLNQFAYAASHDLREPLRNVANYTELLLRTYADRHDGHAERLRNYIVEGVGRMEMLLSDLLAYTQIGNTEPPVEVDCNAVLHKVLQNLTTSVDGSGAVITYDTLPVLIGQEVHYVQLFQNLISNAIKYKGQEPPRIHVGVKWTHNGWLFSVKDNGIGIERQYADKIFGIFKRLHGKDIPGTGIGLAICAKVVERYGGRIWVESEPGQGCEFFFTLPFTEAGERGVAVDGTRHAE